MQEWRLRVFVSEFITGGGWGESPCPASLVREGAAMRAAIVDDLLRIHPDMQVVITADQRLGSEHGASHPRVERVIVANPAEEATAFSRLCTSADAVLVIAPESDGELSRRCAEAYAASPLCLNSTVPAIDCCGDKWATFETLSERHLPTIPTWRAGSEIVIPVSPSGEYVIKPRDGAGSQAMTRVSELQQFLKTCPAPERFVVQPYVPGTHHSLGVIVDRAGGLHILPVTDQRIDLEHGFAYLGGALPSRQISSAMHHRAAELARQVVAVWPGLRGYFGIDLICPVDHPDEWWIVEINPRLTTSYVGYRALSQQNMAEVWLQGTACPLVWSAGGVSFTAEGACRWDI